MNTRVKWFLTLAAVMASLGTQPVLAQEGKGNPEAEAALLKRAEAFVEAFHKGDAKALAGFWTPDGDYTDETGRHFKGREAIAKGFEDLFAENQGLKLRIDIASLRFVTPDVAVEDGTTAVIPPDGSPPSRARYTIVHVKDGQWYLDSVRDAVFAPPSNYEHLGALEWLVGNWVDEAQESEVSRVSFNWAEGQNFLVSSFATLVKNVSVSKGTEWIGWDPIDKRIRSWAFDADGGFGAGAWTAERGKVTIKMNTVLRDGKKLAATNVVTRVDADTLTWEARERSLDGKALPDIKAVRMKRQAE